jgi:hypothetical protein
MSHLKPYMRVQIFIFMLRMSLFIAVGIVLHGAQSTLVIRDCPGLWESMLAILVIKCMRMTICSTVVKMLNNGITQEMKNLSLLNLVVYTIFFITECVMTSVSLNSKECLEAANDTFNGHPMIAYVNCLACIWDGSYILSHVLFLMLNF